MNFIVLKKNFKDEKLLKESFMQIFGKQLSFDDKDNYLIIYHDFKDVDDIKNIINALSIDLSFTPFAYYSFKTKNLEKETSIAINLLDNLDSGIYDLKSAVISSDNVLNKKEIFDYLIYNEGINEEFIKGFINNDLNISKASKNMYIHRNTLIYKLDKFYNDTGFDLRKFKDMYVLYEVMENK